MSDTTYTFLDGLIQGPQGAQGPQGPSGGGEGGTVVHSATATLNYHGPASGALIRHAGVSVSGILEGDAAWCTPSGAPSELGVLGGVVACYVVGDGQVDIIGQLYSLDPIPDPVTQDVTVFWVRPDGT